MKGINTKMSEKDIEMNKDNDQNNEENQQLEEVKAQDKNEENAAAEKKSSKPSSGKGKRLKHGALSVVFTVFFVAAIVLINIIFNMVLDRFDVSADLTDKSMYSIDQTTADYLAGIDDIISIIVTAEETNFESASSYYKQVSEIVKAFSSANMKISASYLDLDENPAFYSKYGATLSTGSIIVESEKTGRNVIITPTDYLSPKYTLDGDEISAEYYSMYYQMGLGSSGRLLVEYYAAAEKCLLSGIMSVTNEDPVRVAVLTEDYGASRPEALCELLEANAYIIEDIKITSVETIDPDYDFIILFAPIYDLSNDDLNKIDMWLDNGGRYDKNMFYAASSQIDELPNINKYIEDWGLSLGTGYVYQTSDYGYAASPTYQQLSPAEGSYSEGVDITTKATYGDRLKPITLLFDEYSIYSTEAIVSSYEGAVVAPFDGLSDFDPSKAEQSGTFPVLASAEKIFYEGVEPHQSRIYVASGHFMLDSTFMQSEYCNNSDIFLNVFNVASGKDRLEISVSPKSFTIETFEITASQRQAIAIVFAVVLPLAVVAAGVVVIVRRKRR